MKEKHEEIFAQFSTTFPAEIIRTWATMVERWELDPNAPNPYEEPHSGEQDWLMSPAFSDLKLSNNSTRRSFGTLEGRSEGTVQK